LKYYLCILPKHKTDTGYSKCESINDFYQLKPRKKVWNAENIELNPRKYYLFSPFSGKYYERELKIYGEDIVPNINKIERQIKEGCIFFKN